MKLGKSQDGVRFLAWETDKSTAETAMEAECLRNGKIFSCMDQEGHLKGDIAYR